MKHCIIPYKPSLETLAKQLRQNSTLSEVLLWNELKNKGVFGFDFDRQKPLDNYIVNFYCKELMLAIEMDGDSHDNSYDANIDRQKALEKLGIRFLRLDDSEVKQNLPNAIREIEAWVLDNRRM